MKILLGWELGAGQGHIQRLTALARALADRGYIPVFALKTYDFRGLHFPWQCLTPPPLLYSGREDSFTFADILATFGFDQRSLLQRYCNSWDDILQTVQPALVIADHAPALVLAARGKIPTIVVGSHFAVPPPVDEFPILRFPAPPASEQRQRQVREAIQQVTGQDLPMGQLLNGDRSFIFSLPELDCYRFWRQQPQYVGIPLAPLPLNQGLLQEPSWAYLARDYPLRDLVLQTLQPRSDFKPLPEVLSRCPLAIHHGGLTTTIACLLMGVPQLLLPRYLEQELTAIAVQRLGAAQLLNPPSWETLLLAQAQTPMLLPQAAAIATRLSPWNANFSEQVIQTCLQMV